MMEWKLGWRVVGFLVMLGSATVGAVASPPDDSDNQDQDVPVRSAPTRQAIKKPARKRGFLFFSPMAESADEAAENSGAATETPVPSRQTGGPGTQGRISVRSTTSPKRLSWLPSRRQPASSDVQIAWQTDLKQAHRLAATAKKPILLVFGAPWCQSCNRMERDVLHRPEIAEQVMADFIPVHVNIDENEQLIKLLEVESIPAVIVLNQDLNVLTRLDGYQSAGKLASALGTVLAADRKLRQVNLELPASDGR